MQEIDFINHATVQDCVKNYKQNLLKKEGVKYNLFTLSSYNNQRENFHSDVIASLLDVDGLHKEGNKFLELFVSYLNTHHQLEIDFNDFKNAETHLEIGDGESRLDITLLGAKKAIIIENKMNGAIDMVNQIDRYFSFIQNRKDHDVCGIVYLTLDGLKNAPTPENIQAEKLLRTIGAFDNTDGDLVSGWLKPCLNICSNEDSRSLIHQYIKLIKHLAHKNMDKNIMDNFYQVVNTKDGIDTAQTIIMLTKNIPSYRADKLAKSIVNYKPFQHYFIYRDNYRLYDVYPDGDFTYKLDFSFSDNGNFWVWFWIPSQETDESQMAIWSKLEAMGMEHGFISRDGNGFMKYFKLEDGYKNLTEMDDAASMFMNQFLERLRELAKKEI